MFAEHNYYMEFVDRQKGQQRFYSVIPLFFLQHF